MYVMMERLKPRGETSLEILQRTAENFLTALQLEEINSFKEVMESADLTSPKKSMKVGLEFDIGSQLQIYKRRELNYYDLYYSVPIFGMPVLVQLFPEKNEFTVNLTLSRHEDFPSHLQGYSRNDYAQQTQNNRYTKRFCSLDFGLLEKELRNLLKS